MIHQMTATGHTSSDLLILHADSAHYRRLRGAWMVVNRVHVALNISQAINIEKLDKLTIIHVALTRLTRARIVYFPWFMYYRLLVVIWTTSHKA